MATFLEAPPPYENWSHWSVRHRMAGPELAVVGERIIGGGRSDDPYDTEGRKTITAIYEIDFANQWTRPVMDLPSGGDNSYPGMVVEDDKTLLVSYYSQHEYLGREGFRHHRKPASIYLARITFD